MRKNKMLDKVNTLGSGNQSNRSNVSLRRGIQHSHTNVTKPTFSIMMACYNCQRFIDTAIESVIDQTFKDWELIIVDDASTDTSVDVAKKYTKIDPRIKLILNTENLGQAIARNIAAELATGQWLAVLDADDVWESHKLTTQWRIISESNSNLVLVGSGYRVVNENGEYVRSYFYPTSSRRLKSNLKSLKKFPPHSSLIYRASVFHHLAGFNARFQRCEDFDLWLRMSEFGDFKANRDLLLRYRLHDTNISNLESKSGYDSSVYTLTALVCQLLRERGDNDPTMGNDNCWQNFLSCISTCYHESKMPELSIHKKLLKDKLKKSSSFVNTITIFTATLFRTPDFLFRELLDKIFGSKLPRVCIKKWCKMR